MIFVFEVVLFSFPVVLGVCDQRGGYEAAGISQVYSLSPCVIYLASVLVVLHTRSYRKRRHHTNIYVPVPCGERRLLLTYFKYITTFKALHCLTSLKVGARYIDKCMYEVRVSLILNGSTAINMAI